MATVKFFKNILEDSYEDITVNAGVTIESVARQYGEDDVYTSNLVECYDSETGETSYIPITDSNDYGIICSVNGVEKTKDYVLEENDVCVVFITPMSGENSNGTWNWTHAWVGLGLGIALGALTGGAAWWYALTSFTEMWTWVGVGAGVGGFIGFLAGGITQKGKNNEKTSIQHPDVAGSANQPITGNPIPLVLGRMEVSPFIVGSPYVHFENVGGKDAYVEALYLIGYSPLRLSDIKFDFLPVTECKHNGKEIYAGKISGPETDGGDIKVKWNANKVEFEVIQQNDDKKQLYLGDNYNIATKQTSIDATPMFVKDSCISDLEQKSSDLLKLVNYHNKGYDDGFRTNSIRFSEQYVKNLEVVIDLPDAVYKERSEDSSTKRVSIPLWIAIQWRPFNKVTNDQGVEMKNSGNYGYDWNATQQKDGWITFDNIRIDDVSYNEDGTVKHTGLQAPEKYTDAKRKEDFNAHTGNKISEHISSELMPNESVNSIISGKVILDTPAGRFETPAVSVRWQNNKLSFANMTQSQYGTYPVFTYESVSNKRLYVPNEPWPFCPIPKDTYKSLPKETDKTSAYYDYKYVECTNWICTPTDYTAYYGNEGWLDSLAFNMKDVQDYITGKNKNEFNLNEIRVTAKADLKKFCEDNRLMPEDFLYGDTNTTKAIEVRVIRISPNYIDETKSSSKIGPWSFHDTIKWTTLTSFTIKTDDTDVNKKTLGGSYNTKFKNDRSLKIELNNRPVVSSSTMKAAGWNDVEDGAKCTVYTTTYPETGEHSEYVNLTPIMADGTVKTPTQLSAYATAYLQNKTDTDSIVLGTYNNTKDAVYDAEKLHYYQSLYYFPENTFIINDMTNEIPISEEKYRKSCLLSLKCKIDNTGNINGQISKLSVIAQSFQPVWSTTDRKWYPENITSAFKYYDPDGGEATKTEYEAYRQAGNTSAERTKGGNNWLDIIRGEIFGQTYEGASKNPDYASSDNCVYLTPSVMKYLERTEGEDTIYNNSAASAFLMATIGGHLGKEALGYSRSHLLSLGEWWEDCQDVYDGYYHVFMGCNGYIYSQMKLEDLLAKITVAGRASYTLDDNGKLVAVMDKPVDYPVGMLNNQNALSTSVTYDYKPAPSGFMINFKNKDNYNIDESMPVMQNGEDFRNPRREIETAQIDLVTDKIQVWSLGRYMMANRIFGKHALSWKSGIEGFDLQFGNVIKVSNTSLLIGQGCGRIAEIIEDDDYVYGFILTDSYENDGATNHAIEIMQMAQTGESRVIVRNVNNSAYNGDEEDYKNPKVGLTNKVILSTPEAKNPTENAVLVFEPEIGDNVTYGVSNKVTSLYRIKSKSPDSNFTFTFALTPYCPSFYNYGDKMPEINNNMTIPSRVSDAEISVDNQATLNDINSRIEETKNDLETQIAEAVFDATSVYQLDLNSPVITKNSNGAFYDGHIKLISKKFSNNNSETYPCYYKLFYTTSEGVKSSIYETPEGGDPISEYTADVSTYTNAFSFIVEAYYKKDGSLFEFDNQTISIISDGSSEDKSITVIMSNENHGFAGDSEKAIDGYATSKVYVYRGTDPTPCVVSKIDDKTPTKQYQESSIAGLYFMVDETTASNVINIYFKATTSLVVTSGEISIQITANGITYDKVFSFTVSRKPEDPYILYVMGPNIIRNNTGSVTLVPFITKGNEDILTIPTGMKIVWYKDDEEPTIYSSGNVSACKFIVSASSVTDKSDICCRLEDV